jgi:hypothetical protein
MSAVDIWEAVIQGESEKRTPKLREYQDRSFEEQLRLLYQRLAAERDTGIKIGTFGANDAEIQNSWMWNYLKVPSKKDLRYAIIGWVRAASFLPMRSIHDQIEAVIAIAAITWMTEENRASLIEKLAAPVLPRSET